MVCIYCGNETKITNSRAQKRTNGVWRRRTCQSCGSTFTSVEAPDLSGSISVKSAMQLEAFQRDKLFMSVYDSLRHRKTALSDATMLTDTVLQRLYPKIHTATVQKQQIIEVTLLVLNRFDKVAATHYQAFHPL